MEPQRKIFLSEKEIQSSIIKKDTGKQGQLREPDLGPHRGRVGISIQRCHYSPSIFLCRTTDSQIQGKKTQISDKGDTLSYLTAKKKKKDNSVVTKYPSSNYIF